MYSNDKTAALGLGKLAIEGLELLDSEARVQEVLSEIVGAYGKVNSISPVPPTRSGLPNEYKYLVNFDRTLDAMTAASELKCLLIGFSALVVSVSRNAGYA